MSKNPCSALRGRKREICEGKSGLGQLKRLQYIHLWVSTGALPDEAINYANNNPEQEKPTGVIRGLGDVVANITEATGVARVVHEVSRVIGVDCGCAGRREYLNEKFPVKIKVPEGPQYQQQQQRR